MAHTRALITGGPAVSCAPAASEETAMAEIIRV